MLLDSSDASLVHSCLCRL